MTQTKYGGHGGREDLPQEKANESPWLTRLPRQCVRHRLSRTPWSRLLARRNQEQTRRVTETSPSPAHAFIAMPPSIPTYRRIGDGDVFKGFDALCKLSYFDAHAEGVKTGSESPVTEGTAQTINCAPMMPIPSPASNATYPRTMLPRVTRSRFIPGIKTPMAQQENLITTPTGMLHARKWHLRLRPMPRGILLRPQNHSLLSLE